MDIDSKVDRLSILPEKILHRILYRNGLKSAAKSCVLSKAWRYVWCTNPTLLFHQDDKSLSLFVLDKILQTYHVRNLRLEEFALCLNYEDDSAPLLNKWIPILIHDMGLKSLEISSFLWGSKLIQLPSMIYESPNNIEYLFLSGCMFDDQVGRVDLKHLQTLYLSNVYIPEEILDQVLSGCPVLEDVSLRSCEGFARIKLFVDKKHTSLTRFCFDGKRIIRRPDDAREVSVEIGDDIQTLETIELERCLFSFSPEKPLEYARLTRLSLRKVTLSSGLFSCNLHSLEELKLDECKGIKEFKLSSRSMKRLDIHNISKPFRVTVNALSIVSFNYEGVLPQSISFAMTSSNDHLWKSEIILESSSNETSRCFNELYGLLKAVSQSEISLKLDQIEIRRFRRQLPDGDDTNIKHELPVAVEHLTIKRPEINLHPSAAPFLNRLFLMFRPSFIYMGTSMMNNSNKDSNKEYRGIAELLFEESERTQSNFWECVLEGVSLQVKYRKQSEWQPVEYMSFEEVSKNEWQPVEYTSFAEVSKEGADGKLELRIQLKWND